MTDTPREVQARHWEAAALEIWQRFVATFPEVDAATEIGLYKVIAVIIAKHEGAELESLREALRNPKCLHGIPLNMHCGRCSHVSGKTNQREWAIPALSSVPAPTTELGECSECGKPYKDCQHGL